MPVYLQVRQVRDALYREAGFTSGSGQPTTPQMGVLFHDAVSSLFSTDQDRNIATTLAAANIPLKPGALPSAATFTSVPLVRS